MRTYKLVTLTVFFGIFFQSIALSELKELEKLTNLEPLQKPTPLKVGKTIKVLKNGKPFETKVVNSSIDTMELKSNDGCIQKNSTEVFTMCLQWSNCSWGDGGSINKLKGESWPLTMGKSGNIKSKVMVGQLRDLVKWQML